MSEPHLLSRDGSLWVLAKPSGYASHPTGDPSVPDLLTWAREGLGAPEELAPIHRLDRETSGVLLASPDPSLRAELGEVFASGAVQKRYRALVIGVTRPKGVVRRPLADGRRGRPLEAVTRYRRLAVHGRLSLLEVRPATGRRHQIRRHLQGLGHPVVGDERYPPRRFVAVPGFPGRLWLHAASIELPDGRTFEAPLPEELEAHLALLVSRDAERESP